MILPCRLSPGGRATERAIARIRLLGCAAVAGCLIVAVAGFLQPQRSPDSAHENQGKFWMAQR